MKTFVSFLLVGLLMVCPQLCRAVPLACCADCCEETGTPDDDSKTPPASDNEPVSCICAGAIKDSGRLIPSDEAAPRSGGAPPFLVATQLDLSHLVEHAADGEPPGRAPAGSRRLHLMLEIFRC
ncbi:MAG: hypothetical protein U0790_25725 [Isosphaeraceae bacterium]